MNISGVAEGVLVDQLDPGTHAEQDTDETGPTPAHVNVLQYQVAPGRYTSGDNPKGGLRRIGGDVGTGGVDRTGLQYDGGTGTRSIFGDVDTCPCGRQHFFGMGACGTGSCTVVGPSAPRPGEQHRRLHLSAGYGKRVIDAL